MPAKRVFIHFVGKGPAPRTIYSLPPIRNLLVNANGRGNTGIGRCHVSNLETAQNNCADDPGCDSVIHDKFGYEPRNQKSNLIEPDSRADYLYILRTNRPCTGNW